MKVILCGGGETKQTQEVNKLYTSLIDNEKPVLYIPVAMEEQEYSNCLEWIKSELEPHGIGKIDMITDLYSLKPCDVNEYSSIFIGRGNTYRLLYLLKDSGAFQLIQDYIKSGGIVFASSAGAIVFSKDIHCTDYADDNTVNQQDTRGFDILKGYDICCHYTNRDDERNQYEYRWISDYVKMGNKVLALPEETSLFIEGDRVTVIGSKDCTLFEEDTTIIEVDKSYDFNILD